MQKTTHSITKIMLLLLFVCLLIMSSVFIYHYQYQKNPIRLNHDRALIFATGRDIKPFTLLTHQNEKFSERNFRNHWTILFFGFTHCSTICPVTMKMLEEAYPKLHSEFPNLQVVLVSIDPERDSNQVTADYAERFHPDFYGVAGKATEIRKLQGQLGIASATDENNHDANYQLIHTASLMLINPQGKWVGMIQSGMKPEEFQQVLRESIMNAGS